MNPIYILENLQSKIELDTVLHTIDCKEDSPVYEDIVEDYNSIIDEILTLAEPVGILGFGTLTDLTATEKYPAGTSVIYAVLSVGDKIKQRSTQAFSDGDYVKGMLCDAMADCALFSLESSLTEKLREICTEYNIGIAARLEAPHDIPMEIQKEAWEQLNLKNSFGIDLSSGYMFDPVKTSCQVFIVTDDVSMFMTKHDCRKCSNFSCKFRNIPPTEIKVVKDGIATTLNVNNNESLMTALIREGHYISAVCGGTGRCGKCKIKVTDGNAPINSEDSNFFTEQELNDGWRLSCTLYPNEDLTIVFEQNDESDFEVVTDYESITSAKTSSEVSEYKIAIDIGTTTVALQLLADSDVCHTVTMINRQRQYGADVVSRIKASVEGKRDELKEIIKTDLSNGISKLCSEYGIELSQISKIAIAANTTMGHILMGYDCESLGKYPFTPVSIDSITGSAKDIIGIECNAEVTLLPGISTYVGGDIVSGLLACGFDESDDICMLVDLGTNGEMALGNKNKILVTSTAAGPAFEGGNISCGVGSVDGAICSVRLNSETPDIQTIRDKSPVGICGTGVVELTAELLREELIDETGLLDDDYFDDGFPIAKNISGDDIVFTQKDIRELQLAKAAIRAGAETLILRYGINKDEISRVYIAGGFGYKLDTEKAIAIGMLPVEFRNSTQAVGNSSLAGAVKYLTEKTFNLDNIVNVSDEISLSTDKDFNEFYMDAMMFSIE